MAQVTSLIGPPPNSLLQLMPLGTPAGVRLASFEPRLERAYRGMMKAPTCLWLTTGSVRHATLPRCLQCVRVPFQLVEKPSCPPVIGFVFRAAFIVKGVLHGGNWQQ